jgi:hypothetical protein
VVGLRRLFDDSIILAGHPSPCELLALAEAFALSHSATSLDRHVDCVGCCHRALERLAALPGGMDVVPGFSAAQLGGLPEVIPGHQEQRLATSGIRSRVRHPVYLGHLCEMLAWSLGSGLAVCYGLTAFAVVTGAIMIRLEDRELEQRFGEAYREYRRQVPAVLPGTFFARSGR